MRKIPVEFVREAVFSISKENAANSSPAELAKAPATMDWM
jgi:hypothetical protein